METESVRSGRSDRSSHHNSTRPSHHSRHHGGHHERHAPAGAALPPTVSGGTASERQHLRSGGGGRRSDRDTDQETDRDDAVSTRRGGQPPRDLGALGMLPEGGERGGGGEGGDSEWGETTTVVTGATSDVGYSTENVRMVDPPATLSFLCSRYVGAALAGVVCVIAFLSPIVMATLPKLGIAGWQLVGTTADAEGLLIGAAFKLLLLVLGSWALFLRRPKSTMPRVFVFRAVVVFLVFILTFAYWLFYGVRIFRKPCMRGDRTFPSLSDDVVPPEGGDEGAYDPGPGPSELRQSAECYRDVVSFAVSMVDALLFLHYIAVVLVELRQLQAQFVVKVTRSPDGATRSYAVGQLSVQRLAVWCLEQYYRDFQVYNPYLESLPRHSAPPRLLSEFKVYDVDGLSAPISANAASLGPGGARGILAAAAASAAASRRRGGGSSVGGRHNERFYEEQEYERRVARRKARLSVAAEEAFSHIRRMRLESGPSEPMSAEEAAEAILPTLARPLQRYLRVTRQQPRYSMTSVLDHLTLCIANDMSHKAFLSRYLTQGEVIWNDKDRAASDTWTLVSERLVSRSASDGTTFRLCQGDVVLLVSVRRLPHLNVVEEALDSKGAKFVLRLDSETSV